MREAIRAALQQVAADVEQDAEADLIAAPFLALRGAQVVQITGPGAALFVQHYGCVQPLGGQ